MHRTTWGIIYCLVAVGIAVSAVLLGRSVTSDSEPLALAGVSLCITTLAASRFATDHGWLKSARSSVTVREAALTQAETKLHMREVLLEKQTQQALREMDQLDHQRKEELELERRAMVQAADTEAEARETTWNTSRSDQLQKAVRVGYNLGVRGLDITSIDNMAQVINLPVGERGTTTMGEGRLSNR